MLDHPFLPALYASFQTKTHICLITDYCPGGELFLLLDRQPTKVLKEDAVRFYAAEVIVALEYLHCQGIIYRDLKPENILIQKNGHIALTDFDLSCLTSCMPQLMVPEISGKKSKHKAQQNPIFLAEPMRASNSFVGTEEYIAPEIIGGAGHTSAVSWWALGILMYEMLYGYTPFRGKTRQRTFTNVLQKNLKFPANKQVSLHAKQLIYQLLQKDPKNRLGAYEGANEIKCHPFFRKINWALIRCMKNRAMFEPFIEDDVPFDEYCQSMGKDGTWAGHMELQVASLVTCNNICIHCHMSPRWYIRNFDNQGARMIHLWVEYVNEHKQVADEELDNGMNEI